MGLEKRHLLALVLVIAAATVIGMAMALPSSGQGQLTVVGNLDVRGTIKRAGNTVWDAGNDGPGSGLDADTVDGKNADELGFKECDLIGTAETGNDGMTDCQNAGYTICVLRDQRYWSDYEWYYQLESCSAIAECSELGYPGTWPHLSCIRYKGDRTVCCR